MTDPCALVTPLRRGSTPDRRAGACDWNEAYVTAVRTRRGRLGEGRGRRSAALPTRKTSQTHGAENTGRQRLFGESFVTHRPVTQRCHENSGGGTPWPSF